MTTDSPLSHLQAALTGRYEIERELGRGGMATVYLARDLRHDRLVALKLLSADLGAVLGAERFLSEIRVTANLQHPNLLPLFDSGAADGLLYYVMPYVEGETLRHRLDRERQLPVDEAVRIAIAIAGALDYAHQHGVIHRDLKPENILLQHGQPVVADFGIALAVSNAGGQRVTQTGLSLGTPQYMSPEQATGDRVIDARSDIYSLGALTYEMLAGEPPHSGTTAQAIIARLMTEEPRPLANVRRSVPEHVDDAVRCALEKLPADRFASAKEFADALRGGAVRSRAYSQRTRSGVPSVSAVMASRRWRYAALAAGIVGLLLGGIGVNAWRASRSAIPRPARFVIEPPAGLSIYDRVIDIPFALSPDGQMVVFAAGTDGDLYLRRLDQLDPVRVTKAERPGNLRFSDDGSWLAFRGDNQLFKVPVGKGEMGAAPTMIRDSIGGGMRFGWTRNSDIVYSTQVALWRMTSSGGSPEKIASRDSLQDGFWWTPTVIDKGRTIAFRISPRNRVRPGSAADRLGLVSIDGGPRRLVDLEVQNVLGYVDGFLIYGRSDGRILGVRLDLTSGKVSGEPVVLQDNVAFKFLSGVDAALAENGTLAYLAGSVTSRIERVDLRGVTLATLPTENRKYLTVNWSPDGTRLLLQSALDDGADLWVYDPASQVTTRLTPEGNAQQGRWTPDGKRVSFLKITAGNAAYWVPADGSTPPVPIPQGTEFSSGFGFSSDGRYLMFFTRPPAEQSMTVVPMDGSQRFTILAGTRQPTLPITSPDGKWMAYTSTESGRREVYIRSFPTGGGRLQISGNGGSNIGLSPDGRRLYFVTPTALRVATLEVGGPLPRVVRTDSLFPHDFRDYSEHPGGKEIALLRESSTGVKLVVVMNWLDEAMPKLKGAKGR